MNKLTKLLSVFVLAGALGMGVAGTTACKNNGNSGEPPVVPTHEYTYTQNSDGKTHNGVCKVDGCTEHAPITDEACVDGDDADELCDKCHQPITKDSGETTDNAVVPEYTGPAAGPIAGEQHATAGFTAENSPAAGWTDGCVTIVSGAIRNRDALQEDASTKITGYTKSVQNGVIEIKLPVRGKITIEYSSGSGTIGGASYKLTKPSGTPEVVTVNYAAKVLRTLVIEDAEAGTYRFEKNGGTIDTYNVKVEYTTTATPIKSIEITNSGTTDYLVTQKVDCTDVEIIAKDEGGVTHSVSLANCEFDTSAYKPNESGEYEIGVTYHLAGNLDSATKDFTATYKVKVYMVDSIALETIGLASNKQVTVQQAYLPGSTFNSDNLSIIATCGFGNSNITQKLKKEWVTVSAPTLTAEGNQTVTVSVDSKYTTDNKAVSATYEVAVKAKKDVVDNKVEVRVGSTGEFKTLTQAVQYLKACAYESGVNKIIKVQPGTYTEKVWIDVDNVTLQGLGSTVDDTKITYSLVEGDRDTLSGSLWALNCATVHVTGKNFKAYNIAIRNDFDYIANNKNYSGSQAAQGVALTLEGDGNVIYNCHLFGNQDTLYMKSGRTYYKDTQIDGNIDFIFGGETSLAYFDQCKIVAIDRENKTSTDPQNGYVTAPQHKDATKPDYGYVFYRCTLTDDGKVNANSMSLGRPWGPKATVSYIECKFSDAYSQEASDGSHKIHRWNNWDANILAANADYSEYGSTDLEGNPIMQTAVTGGSVLTDASGYTKENIFGTSNGKQAYNMAFDCDTAYSNLRILVGLDSGTVVEDPVKTYDLLGYNGGQLQGATGEYLGIKIDATTGKFNNRVPTNQDVQINTGVILYVPAAGNYAVSITDYNGNPLSTSNYDLDYVDIDSVHYAKITFTANSYIKSISVNSAETVTLYSVSFDLNGATEGTAPATQKVIANGKLKSVTDPSWTGHTFEGWYTAAEGGEKVDFATYSVTADGVTLYAHWTEGTVTLEPALISEAKDFNFGKMSGVTAITTAVENQEKLVDGLLVNGTFKSNGGGWYSIANGTTIKIRVAAGLKIVVTTYNASNSFTCAIGDGEATAVTYADTNIGEGGNPGFEIAAQGSETVITLTATSSGYIGAIILEAVSGGEVVVPEIPSEVTVTTAQTVADLYTTYNISEDWEFEMNTGRGWVAPDKTEPAPAGDYECRLTYIGDGTPATTEVTFTLKVTEA